MSQKNLYYLITFLTEFARTLPHSFVTIYMLNNGISLAQLALIQMAYMIGVILFEVPSGVISDLISRKKVFLSSVILIIISYVMYFFYPIFIIVLIAQFIYGISMAFSTGTIEAVIIDNLQESTNSKDLIKKFISMNEIINTVSMIIGAGLGSVIYSMYGNKVYLIAISLFSFSAILGLFISDNKTKDINHKREDKSTNLFVKHFKEGFIYLFKDKTLLVIVTYMVFLQFIIQPSFQYWQPLMLELNINSLYFGLVYILMQVIGLISGYMYNKYFSNRKLNIVGLFTLMGGMLIMLFLLHSTILSFIVFIFLIVPRTFTYIELTSMMHSRISNNVRATVTSFVSMYTRIFSLITLTLISITLSYTNNIKLVFLISALIFLVVTLSIDILRRQNFKKTDLSTRF